MFGYVMSLFRDKKKTMSDAAAPAAAEAAVVVVLSPRRAKRLRVRSADFARLRAGPPRSRPAKRSPL